MKLKREWLLHHVYIIPISCLLGYMNVTVGAVESENEAQDSSTIETTDASNTQPHLVATPKCSNYESQYVFDGTNASIVSALSAYSVPASYAGYTVTEIGPGAFSLDSVNFANIPGTITNIGDGAFANCFNLRTVVLSNGVVELGKNCFCFCLSLESLKASDSLQIIGDQAFYQCRSINTISLGQGITSIGNRAFAYGGMKTITIPANVKYIGQNAFFACGNLTNITVSSSNPFYTSLDNVFYDSGCVKLIQYPMAKNNVNFTIPKSVNSVGDCAFFSVNSLRNLTITENVTNIATTAFYSNKIASFSVSTSNPSYTSKNGVLYSKDFDTLVNYPVNLQNQFEFPTNLQKIGDYAFNSCVNLKTVIIPDTVTEIGEHAFLNCSHLYSVIVGTNVTSIDNFAFYGCSSLTNIVIPDSVTNIGVSAFYGCTALGEITLGKHVANIGTYSFANCAKTLDICSKGDAPTMVNVFSSGTTNTILYLPGALGWESVKDINLKSWDFSPKVWATKTHIVLTWPMGTLLETTNPATGPWVTNTASSPLIVSPDPNSPMKFYNVQYSK